MRQFKKNKLANTDIHVSSLGFGGAIIGGLLEKVEQANSVQALNASKTFSIQYYDTAPYYGFGLSERLIGDAIRDEDVILSTKVGRLLKPGMPSNPIELGWPNPLPFTPHFDYSYDGIMRSYDDSLQRLGMDKIDILLVHDIGQMTHPNDHQKYWQQLTSSGYQALQELKENKCIQAIGMGINETEVCHQALDFADWDVFLLAGRYTLLEQSKGLDLFDRCHKQGTSIIIGGPFNSGILVGGKTFNYASVPEHIFNKVSRIQAVCQRHNVAMPAAALQFPLANNQVISVIPGTKSIDELNQIIEWTSQDIDYEFWQDLKKQQLVDERAPLPEVNPYYQMK